jgi:hypothetical protein
MPRSNGAARVQVILIPLHGRVAEWLKAHAWKACGGHKPLAGSNPALSAVTATLLFSPSCFSTVPGPGWRPSGCCSPPPVLGVWRSTRHTRALRGHLGRSQQTTPPRTMVLLSHRPATTTTPPPAITTASASVPASLFRRSARSMPTICWLRRKPCRSRFPVLTTPRSFRSADPLTVFLPPQLPRSLKRKRG